MSFDMKRSNFDIYSDWYECYNDISSFWYEHHIINNGVGGFDRFDEIYQEIIVWLYVNVKECEKNAQWRKVNDCIYIKLRRKTDYVWLLLRWPRK